jgi:ribonuclease VapC
MVVDSSALLAIFFAEPEADKFFKQILEAEARLVSAATALETGMVLESRRGESAGRDFDLFLTSVGFQVIAFDGEQLDLARSAWRRFGKGRHPAGLNMGDCIAYALAKHTGEPLLAKGSDFQRTDLELCE